MYFYVENTELFSETFQWEKYCRICCEQHQYLTEKCAPKVSLVY